MDKEQMIKEVTAEVREALKKEHAKKVAEQKRIDDADPFLQKLKKYRD